MDQAIESLRMIQEIIGPDADLVRIPADQALGSLSADLKGPAWSDAELSNQTLELERAPLLEQLKKGRVAYPAADLASTMPPGWILAQADTLIELPLPAVVAAMPSGELRGAERVDEETMAASSMRDYFQRPEPEPEPVPEPEPEPTPEPEPVTASEPAIPESPVPTEWPDTGTPGIETPVPAMEAMEEAAVLPAAEPTGTPTEDLPIPAAPAVADIPVSASRLAAERPMEPVPVPEPEIPVEPPAAAVEVVPESSPATIEPVPLPPIALPGSPALEPAAAEIPESVPEFRQVAAKDLTPKSEPGREASGWDGVERKLDASARAVDLNTVSASVLETLPGVGAFRAQLLIEYRKQNGPLAGIYDLLRIQGIGRRLFRQITGLRPVYKNRRDRHEVLNELLGLPPDHRPSLGQIMQSACEGLGANASILSGADGVMLAQTGLDSLSADRYAAFTPNFFRKTRRYWPILGVEGVQQVILPGAHPRALLHNGSGFSWVLLVQEGKDWNPLMQRAAAIAEEINWLFSPHAVVRQIETGAPDGQGSAP